VAPLKNGAVRVYRENVCGLLLFVEMVSWVASSVFYMQRAFFREKSVYLRCSDREFGLHIDIVTDNIPVELPKLG